MLFILALVGVTSIIVLLYGFFTWNANYWSKQGVPGPKPAFLIGSFPGEVFQTRHMIYEVDRIYNEYRGTTPFIGVFATTTPQLIITDPKVIRQCNVTDFKNFNSNDLSLRMDKESDKLLGRHPFILTGEEWKAKRTEILPAFTMLRVKSMYPIVENVCRKMKEYTKRQLQTNQPFNAKELAAKFTIDVVASCIYGIDSEAFTSDKCEIRDYGGQVLTPSTKVLSYFTAITVFPFLKKMLNISFIEKHVENYFITLLNDAIRMRNESKIERQDYLTFLMELKRKKNISELDMAAHTMAFFVDGFDTSSNVIAHVFYMLGMHKDVQSKLRKEIQDTINKDGDITFENLQEMEYLEQVFNETLRLYPSGGLTKRRCTTATTLSDYNGKQIQINKNLIVIFPMWSIQRDPEYYTDPLKFDPDRFHLDNGGTKKYKEMGVFQPFGDGPRKCFGMRFGVIQSKAAIVEIVKNFEITLNAKTKENYVCVPKDILLQPIGGLWIDLKEIPK